MVLEEAASGSEPEPPFAESLPSSSPDLYAGDRNPTVLRTSEPSYILVSPPGTTPVYVNLSNLPRRWGLSEQPHPKPLVDAVQDSCRMASSMLGRPVRQEEADALAYHFARGIRIGSYGAPIGTTIALLQAYRGYANGSYRFPGWTPNKEKFNPNRFMGGMFQGARARLMWQFARFNAYAFVGMIVGQVFFGSYAMTVGSVGRMHDPRLKELSEKIKERLKNGKDAALLPGGREYDQTPGGRHGETHDMARQRRSVQRQARDAGGVVTDDASPTAGGGDADDRWQEHPATGLMSDGYVKQRDSQTTMEESRRDIEQSRSVGTAPPSPSQQSGSAWDRLRQQAQSGGPGQAPTRHSRETSSTGDSFMFSQAEEDHQLPKTEQQKQFDKRVEREREGKDFEGQPGGGWPK